MTLESYKALINSDFFQDGSICLFLLKNNSEFSIELVSKSFKKNFGYSIENLSFFDIIQDSDKQRIKDNLNRIQNSQAFDFKHLIFNIKDKNNSNVYVENRLLPIKTILIR